MDHALLASAREAQTFVDFGGRTPRRCLDLGTSVCTACSFLFRSSMTFPPSLRVVSAAGSLGRRYGEAVP